jgi:inositol-phosphate transport system permease protein
LTSAGIPQADHDRIVEAAYTGWSWTTRNFELLVSLPSTARYALNTLMYVALTLVIFNVGPRLLSRRQHLLPARTDLRHVPRDLVHAAHPAARPLCADVEMADVGQRVHRFRILAPFGVERINWMMHSARSTPGSR